jgi:transposase
VGCTAADNPLFLNAVLRVMRHGGTWRVLPKRFGKHDSVRKRALRWAQKGPWRYPFDAVRGTELEAVLLDSTIVRAHQRAAGQVKKRGGDEALSRSRSGLSTKLHAAVDERGRP